MPELPEVEVLVRYLRPRLRGRRIRGAVILRPSILRPPDPARSHSLWQGRRIRELRRRGKYICFDLDPCEGLPALFWVHLGMTGRLWLQPAETPLPAPARAFWDLDDARLVFSDPRGFGRCGWDEEPLEQLGLEPLERSFTAARLEGLLARSRQSVKVRLLDQTVVAGLGNIYACESLWEAGLSPGRPSATLSRDERARLVGAIRRVLRRAIRFGSKLDLDWAGAGADRLFYFGLTPDSPRPTRERFAVYDREGQPCSRCGALIRRIPQAGRSSYFCPGCQV
ncbi:MAG: formamidopyrimidine-DNA glycosylase [Limisphaera sp.]|nr:MAG: formamidopyrimidine-DNA glycosylase [Limisphaera sp.]